MGNRKKRTGLLGASTSALLLLVAFTYVLWIALGWRLGDNWPWELERTGTNQYSVTRLTLFVVAGVVGVVGVVVAYRKQLGAEEGQFLERLAESARQLGDQNPTIQAAGVYALAGLADTEGRARRQQCVDVLCAYIRLPYSPLPIEEHAGDLTTTKQKRIRQTRTGPVEEEHTFTFRPHDWGTRQSIIRIIAQHLTKNASVSWSDLHFDFSSSVIDYGDFSKSIFAGSVNFRAAKFIDGNISFDNAIFKRCSLDFSDAIFTNSKIDMHTAKFTRCFVDFSGAICTDSIIDFHSAKLTRCTMDFSSAIFTNGANHFNSISFNCSFVNFNSVKFDKSTTSYDFTKFINCVISFEGAEFASGTVEYYSTNFARSIVSFMGTNFTGADVKFHSTKFAWNRFSYSSAMFTDGSIQFVYTNFNSGIRRYRGLGLHKRLMNSGFVEGFEEAQFTGGKVYFTSVKFSNGTPSFVRSEFTGSIITFTRVKFVNIFAFGMPYAGFSYTKFKDGLVYFKQVEFINGVSEFVGAEFLGGTVDFGDSRFVNQVLGFSPNDFASDSKRAKTIIKIISLIGVDAAPGFSSAVFKGSAVNFAEAAFEGGAVDFGHPRNWSSPPRVPWEVGEMTPEGISPSPWPAAGHPSRLDDPDTPE